MASISTNFPRTFYKLSVTWSKKAGKRTSKDAIFLKCPQAEPISYVPHVVGAALNRADDLVGALKALVPAAHQSDGGLWVYTMRTTDAMPRTTADTERLYAFVRKLLKTDWFDASARMYLEKHIHITVAFFVWWFTTEGFHFATNEIRQTTYHGIRRVWTPVLLPKAPVLLPKTPTTPVRREAPRPSGVKHSAVASAKEVAKCRELRANILALVREEHPDFAVEWEDDVRVHLKVSGCFEMNNDYYVTGKKSKKLQKMYQDYSKLKKKGAVSAALAEEELQADAEELQADAEELQADAEEPAAEVTCSGCLTHQPNQLAHVGPGGCLGEEETPESWEDL